MEKMIFINPATPVNNNIPNICLAYAATHYNVKVIDFNTLPLPKERFLNRHCDTIGISVKSLNWSEAVRIAKTYSIKYPAAKTKSVSTSIDIQCCYPYLDFEEKII